MRVCISELFLVKLKLYFIGPAHSSVVYLFARYLLIIMFLFYFNFIFDSITRASATLARLTIHVHVVLTSRGF